MASDASWAVTLPSTQPSTGEVAQHGMDMRERQFERMAAMQEQHQRQSEVDRRYQEGQKTQHLNFLQKQFDPTSHLTGIQKIDMASTKAASDLYDEMVGKLNNGADWGSIVSEANQRLSPIFTGDAMAKSKYAEGLKQLQEHAAKNKNFDLSKATGDLLGGVANMYVAPNEKGGFTFKPADQVNHETDIAGDMLHPNNRWKYANSTQPLIDAIQNPKGDDWSAFHKNGKGEITEYKSKLPVWAEAPQRDNSGYVKQPPAFKLKTEKIDSRDSKGNPVKIEYVNNDVRNSLLDTPEKEDSFNKMWNEFKQAKGLTNLSNKEEEILSGKFLADVITHNDHNQPQPMHIQQPQKWQIYPNGTGSSKGKGSNEPPTINDVYSGMSSAVDGANGKMNVSDLPTDQQEVALKYARMFSGDNTLSNKNVVVKKDENGELHLTKVKGDKSEEHLGKLDYSINSKANGRDKKTREAINKTITEKRGASAAPKTAKNPTGFVPHKM